MRINVRNQIAIVKMLRSICLLLALVASCFGAAIPSSRIVGGSEASEAQIPWQVSLRWGNFHFCGGSILNQRWILSAAHCLVGFNPTGITVVTNTLFLNAGGDVYRVDRTIIHAGYNATLISNDVGLLHLATDIIYSANVQPAQLPSADFTAVDYPGIVSGWGRTSFPGVAPNHLQYLNVIIVSQEVCRTASWRVLDSNICSFTRVGQGACHGDSGGPLSADGILIGVVSFGNPCAVGTPDVFARVWSFVPWITANMS